VLDLNLNFELLRFKETIVSFINKFYLISFSTKVISRY